MIILHDQDQIVRAWVGQKTGHVFADGHTIGVYSPKRQRLTGGFVFTRYTGAGIELTMAGKGCVCREAWQAVGEFVFNAMGCVRLQVTTPVGTRRNPNPVAQMARKFGFAFEGKARRFYGDRDGLQWSMLRDEAIARGYYQEGITYGRAIAS